MYKSLLAVSGLLCHMTSGVFSLCLLELSFLKAIHLDYAFYHMAPKFFVQHKRCACCCKNFFNIVITLRTSEKYFTVTQNSVSSGFACKLRELCRLFMIGVSSSTNLVLAKYHIYSLLACGSLLTRSKML